MRADFETACRYWTDLLVSRGLPAAVRWVFAEDTARLAPTIEGYHFAFRPRPPAEAERIARFAYDLDPKRALSIVAYAVLRALAERRKAIENCEAGLRIFPGDPPLLQRHARMQPNG